MLRINRKIVLASASPRRKKLLKEMGIPFEASPSSFEEILKPSGQNMIPGKIALHNACGKARDVARKFKNALVIGVDTIGSLRGEVFGKPRNEADAKRILRKLSGTTHDVISAICIIDTKTGKEMTAVEKTKVTFVKMSKDEINRYVSSGEQMDKAAAFAIQGLGAFFIKKINGDYFNVVGLPIFKLGRMLKIML